MMPMLNGLVKSADTRVPEMKCSALTLLIFTLGFESVDEC